MPLPTNLQEILEWRGVEGLVCAEVLTDDDNNGYTTGPVFAIAGVAEISKSTSSSSEAHFYDNMPAVLINSEGSDELTISVSAIPMDVYAAITGQIYDDATGSLIEGPRDFKYYALGYKTKKTNGDEVYVWRYKGSFNIPDQTNSTENDSTDANGQEIVYTGITTTHKWAKTGKGAKALSVDTVKNLANVSTFFNTVTTPDSLPSATSYKLTITTSGGVAGIVHRNSANGPTVLNNGAIYAGDTLYAEFQFGTGVKFNNGATIGDSPATYAVNGNTSLTWVAYTPINIQPTPGWGELGQLNVTSNASATAGYTAITVSGYTMSDGVKYVYSVGSTAATVEWDSVLTTNWTDWDGESDIEAEPGQIITVAVVTTADSKARAAGAAYVVANAVPNALATLTVECAAGTAVGNTAVTVSGYTVSANESYKYKLGAAAAEVDFEDVLTDGWTAWNGSDEIAAEGDQVITVAVVVTADNTAVAAGHATVVLEK